MADELSPVSVAKTRPNWYPVIAILLAIVCLYLAIRQASWDEIAQTIQHVRIEYLITAASISLFNYFLRSQRWGVLLSQEKKIPPMTMFWVTGIGYLGNNFLPFRAGEIIRSVTLGQQVGISKIFVMTTALTERILDSITLVIIGVLVLPLVKAMPGWLPVAMRGMALVSGIAVIVLLFTPRFVKLIFTMVRRIPLAPQWSARLEDLVNQFIQGAQAFLNLKRAAAFTTMTISIWLLDGIGTMIAARAFHLEFQFFQALLLLVGLGLSSAIPSTPGYVGVYQFVAVTVLSIFGYTPNQAIAYILVAQAVNMMVVLVWGLVGLWQMGVSLSNVYQEKSARPTQ
jgi:uncharacterized protein (TIRG00374 family)